MDEQWKNQVNWKIMIRQVRYNHLEAKSLWVSKLVTLVFFIVFIAGCKTERVKDIDGNRYGTVTIGKQIWMKENLKTTKYNDGTPIPLTTDNDTWISLNSPSFCWYGNDSTNKKDYGALYNWFAVNTGKLCPQGWHVAADADWMALIKFLEESAPAKLTGGRLKEAGTAHWRNPNSDATNESGFTALPGGFRSFNGSFNYLQVSGYWWSSTEYNATTVYFLNLRYKFGLIYKYIGDKTNGFSVRCIKDQIGK